MLSLVRYERRDSVQCRAVCTERNGYKYTRERNRKTPCPPGEGDTAFFVCVFSQRSARASLIPREAKTPAVSQSKERAIRGLARR